MQVGAVTCIDFSPQYPYNFAVTASTRVLIYDAVTRKPRTTLSRFKDKASSGTFRADGKLLVAGGESGIVQVGSICAQWGTCCKHRAATQTCMHNKADCAADHLSSASDISCPAAFQPGQGAAAAGCMH